MAYPSPPIGADRSHVERRKLILEKYPQVRELFGKDPVTFKITAAIFVGQIVIAAILGLARPLLLVAVAL